MLDTDDTDNTDDTLWILLGYFWNTFEILLGYCWDTLRIEYVYFLIHFVTLGYSWVLVVIWVLYGTFGYFLGLLVILGMFWYCWVLQGTFGFFCLI